MDPCYDFDQGAFPGSVFTDDAMDFTRLQTEIDPLQCLDTVKTFADMVQF
jgi:hypothetical protein